MTTDAVNVPRVADWFLYTCAICDGRTFLSPAGGNLNCSCSAEAEDVTMTPLYAGDTCTMADLIRDCTQIKEKTA